MHIVVNHLHFRDPVSDLTVEALPDAAQLAVDAGAIGPRAQG